MKIDPYKIYEMKLHDQINFEDKFVQVTRVPGGWLYDCYFTDNETSNAVFVPFDNEFQDVVKDFVESLKERP